MEEGEWSDWSHCTLSQEAGRDERQCSAHSLLFIQSWARPHGIMSHTFKESLPTLMDPIWKDRHRHTQRLVS